MFQRRHYAKVAAIINDCPVAAETRGYLIVRFAMVFHADNPRFNLNRFRDACTVSPPTELLRLP